MAITTKRKALLYTEGANIDANYGPWDSIADYESFITEDVGLDAPYDTTTICVKDPQTGVATKYIYENDQWRLEVPTVTPTDYTHPASHPASMITYNASTEYESGNVGYEIKQLVTSLSAKYVKPGTGIPETDLASDVLTSLGYADDYNTNKSSFVTSTALETALEGLSPYSAGTGISITTVSNGKQIAIDSAVYKVKDVQNASGTSLVTSGIATVPITLINKSDNTLLSPVSGVVTLPEIPDDATDISFDDSITQLSTQGNPINNVQTAIQLLATKIYGYSSTLVITLTYSNGIRVANTVINISAVFRGNNYDFSSQLNDPNNAQYVTTVDNIKKFKTNSSGECRIGLPIGATYELTFSDINNYIKPEPITGITDSTQIIIGASYQAVSDYETVILKVVVHGASGFITPSGKKVYIDTYNQNNTSVVDVEGLYEITLNANGTPNIVKIKEGSSYTTVTDKVIKIDKGILYKVRLDDWDDTGAYTKSTSPLFNAQKVNRGVTLAYTYTLSGTYLLLKDLESEDGYKNYRVVEIDSTNNKIKIAREINGTTSNYWIYKNSNDVYIYEESQDISTAYAWFEGINVDTNNPIIGIGFRSQLLNNPSSSARAISGTCAFCVIPYNVSNITAGALRENGASGADNSNIDGLANEESWLEVDSPTSVITKNIHNITASIGNNTYNAFLPAYRQLEVIIQNINNINLIFSIFNKSLVIAGNDANNSNLWSSTVNTRTNTTGLGANGWNKNMDLVGSSYRYQAYNSYKSIPVFPY